MFRKGLPHALCRTRDEEKHVSQTRGQLLESGEHEQQANEVTNEARHTVNLVVRVQAKGVAHASEQHIPEDALGGAGLQAIVEPRKEENRVRAWPIPS